MRLYDERNSTKGTVTCSYCYNKGHNKRSCPRLKAHYEANKDWDGTTALVGVSKDMFACPARDSLAKLQFRRHFDYAKKVFGGEQAGTKKRRSAKCGFCGSTRHTRRNCNVMKDFLKDLEATERGYREVIYDRLIHNLGFGVGAFIERAEQNWDDLTHKNHSTGLITSVDLNSISIGNLLSRWSDYNTCFGFEIDGEKSWGMSWKEGSFSRELGEQFDLPRPFVQQGWGIVVTKIIAPAPSTPSKEWFLGQSPAFDWVVKKRNLSSLWDVYHDIIQTYHPDGAKVFDKWLKRLKK